MKYYGIIKVFLDEKKATYAGSDFQFELNESNHFKFRSVPEQYASGLVTNTDHIDKAIQDAMGPILNHIVYLQQQSKAK